MSRIFICYRRDDASGHAGRLRDALSVLFGPSAIFRDMETIGPGEDFVHVMSAAIAASPVFLAVIGRQWLSAAAPGATRRLDDERDHVRREIVEALQRGVRVIPVLVQDARMPRADELPPPLAPLATRNAIALDDDSWEADVHRLAAAIRRAMPPEPETGMAKRYGFIRAWDRRHLIAAAGVAAAVALVLWFSDRDEDRTASETSPSPASSAPEARSSPQAPVTLPAGGEAEVGESIVEVVEAGIAGAGPRQIVLLVRVTNRGRYDTLLDGGQFRLVVDGESRPPVNAPVAEVVASETSKDGTIVFDLPAGAEQGHLQIVGGAERAQMALDFTARTGLTASRDRDARRAGSTTVPVRIESDHRQMRFAELVCELRAAVLRRYVNKLTLTLRLRADNGGRYDTTFGDSHFRLLVGDTTIAPVSGLSEIVPSQATREGEIVFDVPLDTTRATLRGRYGDVSATIPLDLSSRSQ